MSSETTNTPSDNIRTQLLRVLESAVFAGSDRLSRFLRRIVEFSIESRGGPLKEHAIGVEVYARLGTTRE